MSWLSVDRNDDDSYRAFPNREDTIRERIKCRRRKGSGLK